MSEVYIGIFIPLAFYFTFVVYFNKNLKKFIYFALFIALDFSCLYGFIQIFLRIIKTGQIKIDRVYLTFGFHNVNIFAGILILIIPLILEFILFRENNKKEKVFLISSFMLYTISIFITFSRGAWLCFIMAVIISLISKKYSKLLITVSIILIFISKPLFSFIITRGTSTSFLQNESAVARLQSIFTDFEIIKKYPFGIGGGQFKYLFKEYAVKGYLSMPESIRFNSTVAHYALEHAHNLILQICVEFGIIATILFLLIIINRLRSSFIDFNFNRGAFTSIIVYLFFSIITGNEFNHKGVITGTIILYLIFGIIEISIKDTNEGRN
ncbi:O-antigen ligase family protein [Thermobrachium celere]|nr:O-antigen ligase family protein [Thermobrachium celere]